MNDSQKRLIEEYLNELASEREIPVKAGAKDTW